VKILSLLPAATEILCELGLSDSIVGISEECNYPDNIKDRPVASRIKLEATNSSKKIDEELRKIIKDNKSPFILNKELIDELNPDFIITQETCSVCAVSRNNVLDLEVKAKIIDYSPSNLNDIPSEITKLADRLSVNKAGEQLKNEFMDEINKIKNATKNIVDRPRVFAMEWLDPLYSAGHWVPEMIEIAGGESGLSMSNEKSKIVDWDQIKKYAPNFIFIMPCGWSIEKTLNDIDCILNNKELNKIPAFNMGNVYIVDADSYYTRPAMRIIEGTKLIARTISPQHFSYEPLPDSILNLQNFIHFESFAG
jgi:iron complex transport system substrate-binding protein